jgi:hypothetical protein
MRLAVATLAALVSVVAADVSITYPGGPNGWWVGKSENRFDWTCNDNPTHPTFTVLIANKDPTILVSPIAIIAQQPNADCSKTVTNQQFNFDQPPAQGYTVLFANVLNSSDVFATSQEFEIKPLGSLYPSQIASSSSAAAAASASTAGSTSGSGAVPSQTASGALSLRESVWGVVGAVAAVAGFVL